MLPVTGPPPLSHHHHGPNTLNNNLRASIPTHAHTHTHTHTYLQPSLLIYQLWSKVPAVATVPTQVQAILKNTKFPLLKVFWKCDVLELLPPKTRWCWFPHTSGDGLHVHPHKMLEGSYSVLQMRRESQVRHLHEVTPGDDRAGIPTRSHLILEPRLLPPTRPGSLPRLTSR